MSGETLYSTRWEEVTSFAKDFIVFILRSIVFICESVYLTLLPKRFRKLKVSIKLKQNIAFHALEKKSKSRKERTQQSLFLLMFDIQTLLSHISN